MSKAVVARQQGDVFQAHFFWLHACKLWISANVSKIEWESDSSFGFDDVVVHYCPHRTDEGDHILHDNYQLKFHVDQRRGFTCQALIDPEFIGTVSDTILNRLHKLFIADPSISRTSRYYIVSNWMIDHSDKLGFILGNGGAIRLDKLFDGSTDRSVLGSIRKSWREHLGGVSDDDLREVLRPLRLIPNHQDLSTILDPLNINLRQAGLKELDPGRRTNGYTELIQKLYAEGKNSFTKEELHKICRQEGLIAEKHNGHSDTHVIGIRSFSKGAEDLGVQVNDLLCLLHFFSGRYIHEEVTWAVVYPLISEFADKAVQAKKQLQIHLDTHLSVAFCLGYCLDPKTGVSFSLIQKTMKGRITWAPELDKIHDVLSANWNWEEKTMNEGGTDLVLSVGITHAIHEEVQDYVEKNLTGVSKMVLASIKSGPSSFSIRDANHCIVAIQELIDQIKPSLVRTGMKGTVHLFIAGPNAFAFFLGRQSKAIGNLVLYEFDFEKQKTGTYHNSISLPIL